MHRFYAPPQRIAGNSIVFDRDETRHLRDVLRLKSGDKVNVFDGAGNEYECRIIEIKKAETLLLVDARVSPISPESPLPLTLAAAMLKADKFDLVVQKAVELGIKRLVPIRTVRCDIKSKDSARRHDRWLKIALESSKQTGRATLMTIDEPVEFSDLLANSQDRNLIMFSERDGGKLCAIPDTEQLTAIVGPEGGWDDTEIDLARKTGITIVTLGGRILRAETAAIAIAAVLQNRFGDLN